MQKHNLFVSATISPPQSKRLEAVETKVPQSKRLEAVETKVPLTGENSADFHVKTLDEIRAARKRKMKNADSTLSRKQPKSSMHIVNLDPCFTCCMCCLTFKVPLVYYMYIHVPDCPCTYMYVYLHVLCNFYNM